LSLEKIKADRLKKLEKIKTAGVNPFPAKAWPRVSIATILDKFDEVVKAKKEIFLVGRLRSLRGHGGSTFANLEDASGQIQVYFKKDELGEEQYDFFVDNIDVGDFIEVAGELFATHKGEKTLLVKKSEILAKALNQLPEKWHGLTDTEERFRKRYLDILMNKEVRQRFEKRSKIIKQLREFFDGQGFMEVETPVLQLLPGGALAKPFKTHLNALDMDLYLRVAPELYLKRLIVGGFEKVYEIGRCFRNEGMDKTHNPDFTELEFYWAYADYEQLMELVEKLFAWLAPSGEIKFQDAKISFRPPFERILMRELILKHYKIDIAKVGRQELENILIEAGGKPEKDVPDCKIVDEIFKTIRGKIIQPTFILNHPLEMSPLAKASESNSKEAARFQLIVGGMEIMNAYNELNDPQDQSRRMKMQENHHSDEEVQRLDSDFIEALEYGLPPTAGLGLGVDRLVQLLTDAPNIREVILFPMMKPKG